ncbi:hypothetical protein F4553_006844 [Allocatelliglobosispora scoriae]|uniref:GH16 domain-containing protein n=1 Tax=Allocatelliglobosispora scoriae TaxID=643052 RepID=A0A841C386_9ACTN|nr:RICIN domain-containing protein [Allocatelliglobosispora scoriae]MBB5873410.1 hypothetical protein [Allocatelliglobosispora scoriae]
MSPKLPALLTASAVLALIAGALTGATAPAQAAAPQAAAPLAAACNVLFDDFAYTSSTDPLIRARNWTVRTNAGGPGVPGASWPASNITFPTADGQRVMQLTASTDGTGAGTSQSEILHQRKFFEGTYASRVRFTDAPVSGADGDHLVETFFTITPLNAPMEPNYGEIDFEYLPNGGWGEPSATFFETTWETYQADPWIADNINNAQRRSYDGWHDLAVTVSAGRVKYYIDGALVADHGDKYYPETPMSINFNLWLIDLAGHTGGRSTWIQQVDWVYYTDREVITTADAKSRVASYRTAGTTHVDNVGGASSCQSTTDRPLIGLANKCADVRSSNTADGTPIQLYDCNGTGAQKWTNVGTSWRVLGKCLDIVGGGTANGTKVHLWSCLGVGSQNWQLRADQSLFNPQSGRCLDVPGGNSANSTQLAIWDCNGTAAQRWRLG